MTRKTPTRRRGLNLRDPSVTSRLDATGIPADVAATLARMNVGVGVIERLHATPLDWDYVRTLTHTRALTSAEDVAALVTFSNQGLGVEEITQWAQLGDMDAGLRLFLRNVPLDIIRAFPLNADHGLQAVLKMIGSVANTGIHINDMPLWHTAGVISLSPPHLHEDRWTVWRSAAVNYLGMRPAALAAAAGLSVPEAIEQWNTGEFDAEAMRMMAALRSGTL
jgi:hypothetical protein